MNKKKLFRYCLFLLMIGSTTLSVKANADTTVQTPVVTRLYQLNNHAKIEWSNDIAASDILQETSFESGQSIPNFQWYGTGGQTITTEDKYTGSNSVRIPITTGLRGNWYNFPSTSSDNDIMMWDRRVNTPNGTNLSLTIKAKSIGNSTIYPNVDGGWARSFYTLPNRLVRTVPSGSNVLYLDSLDGIYRGQYFTTDTNVNSVVWVACVTSIDYVNKSVTMSSAVNRTMSAWENIVCRPWRGYGFQARTVKTGGWQTFSMNTFVPNYSDFDFTNGAFYIGTNTDGVLYIDDVKFGYATLVNVYRDGNNVYSGYLSDFEDSGAIDKVNPNPVSAINNNFSGGVSHITWNAQADYGTGYNYTIQGISKSSIPSALSGNYRLTVTSGIKGYSIVVDNNPNTIPSNTITTTTPSYDVNTAQGSYFHIASIDNAGNISTVSHFNIDKIAPSNPIIKTTSVISPAPFNWVNGNVGVSIQSGIDNETGVNRTEYSLDLGNSWITYSSPFVLSDEKAYTILARTIDNNENYSAVSRLQFGIDKLPANATVVIPSVTTTRNIAVTINNISDNASGQYTVRLANKSDFSDATGYVVVQGLTSKPINFTLDQRTPYTANYTDRIVYVELKDIAGNSRIIQATTKFEPLPPSVPVIANPLDNTVRLIKEGTMIEWKYSDINNDPSPLAQAKSELFIYKGADLVKDFVLNGTTSSVYVNDLPYGDYNVKVTVWNSLGKSATSNPSKLRINKFLEEGSLITKTFETSSPMKYVEVLTTSEIPFGTELYANIYISDKDGNYDSTKPIKTEIHNVRDNKNLIKLPRPTSYLRVEYKLYNKTSTSNDAITPSIDNITVLAK